VVAATAIWRDIDASIGDVPRQEKGEISDAFVDISPTRGEFSIEESTMQWRVSVHGTLIDFGCVVVCSWQQTHFMPRGFVLNRVV